MKTFIFLLISLIFYEAFSKTAEEWKSRVIYQIMTDRFSKTEESDIACSDLNNYCGGTFKGIERNLDYIQGLGVNAIWISPIQRNAEGAYHGYGVINFYEVNEHFGTEQDFKDLVKACHDRDIWIMVDVVANHVGFVQPADKAHETENNDYSKVVPFNDAKYYHPFKIECHYAEEVMDDPEPILETCWLCYLPDLNQSIPFVRNTLLEWVNWLVKTYDIDGLRLDALRHINKGFWEEFSKSAGVFTVGEIWSTNIEYAAGYQTCVDSVLNFPLQENLNQTFSQEKPLTLLSDYYKEANIKWKDISVLANFLDCHDKPRFLSHNNDVPSFKAALSFTICSIGIPTIYYGNEQGFIGGEEPRNRESLWPHLDKNHEMYKFIKTLTEFRIKTEFYKFEQIERLADYDFYAFTRGKYFFAYSNSLETVSREITNHPYEDQTWLCNAFNRDDCIQVNNLKFTVSIANKDSKILFPKSIEDDKKSVASKIWDQIKNECGMALVSSSSFK